jgi:hypothetical protein
MKAAAIICALVDFVTGLIAARYWLKASELPVNPTWKIEPGQKKAAQDGWIAGTLVNLDEVGRLNSRAAKWIAVSVIFSTASSVLGLL